MTNLERIAYLKYMKKLIEQEVDHLQRETDFPEEPVSLALGSIQTQRNMSYTFNNNVIMDIVGVELFPKIAKVSKSTLSSVLTPSQMTEAMKFCETQPSAPFLKLTQTQFPEAKAAVKIGNKFRTIFKLS